jgi:hypothetical protein
LSFDDFDLSLLGDTSLDRNTAGFETKVSEFFVHIARTPAFTTRTKAQFLIVASVAMRRSMPWLPTQSRLTKLRLLPIKYDWKKKG